MIFLSIEVFMKKDTHPKYQQVLFVDSSNGFKLLCGSTVQTKHTETHEGKEYPAVHVSISSASHPFFVGGKQFVDTEGRVDKFTKKYAAKQQQQQQQQEQKQQMAAKEKEAKKKPAKKPAKTASKNAAAV
jgi:large subunit ribosomal protein L31